MAIEWTAYEDLLYGEGVYNLREHAAKDAVNSFIRGIVNDPAFQPDATINGELNPIVASRRSPIACSIKAAPDIKLHIGDIVGCMNCTWIVVEAYTDKIGLRCGTMWLCNNVIKFQNGTVDVYDQPCVIDDGSYTKDSTDPDAKTMSNTYKIYMPINDNTKKMFVDKRLAIDVAYSATLEMILEVYRIIGIDAQSRNHEEEDHLMLITAQRDVYNPATDSLEDMLCDIVTADDDESEPSEVTGGSCSLDGRDTIRIGTTRKYTATFVDANGDVVTGIEPVFEVDVAESITSVISDNVCQLTIPFNSELIGETITIVLSDTNSAYGTYTKKVQVVAVG